MMSVSGYQLPVCILKDERRTWGPLHGYIERPTSNVKAYLSA